VYYEIPLIQTVTLGVAVIIFIVSLGFEVANLYSSLNLISDAFVGSVMRLKLAELLKSEQPPLF
jgi:hypothetical protein